jgi:hypothetical protein
MTKDEYKREMKWHKKRLRRLVNWPYIDPEGFYRSGSMCGCGSMPPPRSNTDADVPGVC